MRAVVQRVSRASVKVNGELTGEIADGLLVLLGVGHDDGESDADYLADKIAGLRIFEDEAGKMNRSVADVDGAVLAVSRTRQHSVSIFRRAHPRSGPALRDREIPGNNGSRAGQPGTGDHPA